MEVIDNFLDNPEEVRKFAIQNKYYPPTVSDNWLGFRTKVFNEKDPGLVGDILKKVSNSLEKKLKIDSKNFSISSYFHYSPEISQILAGNVFDDYKFHIDYNSNYAGLIYLSHNPPANSGTSFIKSEGVFEVSNKYNRMVFYNANILHAPTSFFGEAIDDARLTFLFFVKQKNFMKFSSNSTSIFNLN